MPTPHHTSVIYLPRCVFVPLKLSTVDIVVGLSAVDVVGGFQESTVFRWGI